MQIFRSLPRITDRRQRLGLLRRHSRPRARQPYRHSAVTGRLRVTGPGFRRDIYEKENPVINAHNAPGRRGALAWPGGAWTWTIALASESVRQALSVCPFLAQAGSAGSRRAAGLAAAACQGAAGPGPQCTTRQCHVCMLRPGCVAVRRRSQPGGQSGRIKSHTHLRRSGPVRGAGKDIPSRCLLHCGREARASCKESRDSEGTGS